MPVDVYVDAYPGKVFAGRVAGFSPATGARLSLLPPENATGNFVKVVQRLPVRIELDEAPFRRNAAVRGPVGGAGGALQGPAVRARTPASGLPDARSRNLAMPPAK